MGIKGLMKILSEHAHKCLKEQEMENYFGRKVAIDASMSLYQFLIQIRSGPEGEVLTNEAGEVTSHLQGLFYRTIRMLDCGLKPCFVFDGKPPNLKGQELDKRTARRDEVEEAKRVAEEEENQEDVNKFKRQLVKVTKEHNAEARQLLRLMGVPIVEAPGEAEAQCAQLVKDGHVYAVATEDMDALTFGAPKLLRHLTFSAQRKEPIVEIDLQTALKELNLTMEEFIDMCILCGCDYTGNIKGIGPSTAYKLIQQYHTLEKVVQHIKTEDKYKLPEEFLYKEAAELFKQPDVLAGDAMPKLEWKDPDEEGLIKFLVNEKGFNLERVQTQLKRLKGARQKANQQRLEGFFKVAAPAPDAPVFEKLGKRKEAPASSNKKKAAGGLAKKAKTAK